MEPIGTDLVSILKAVGSRDYLQNHAVPEIFEHLMLFVKQGYDIDCYRIPDEGDPFVVFVATKEGEVSQAMGARRLRLRTRMITLCFTRERIINAAKDIHQSRLRQKIFWQWVGGMAILVVLLDIVLTAMVLLAYGYSDQILLLTIPVAIVSVFVGCGAIPWIASRVFFERAWSRNPLAQLIDEELRTLSTD